MWCVCVFVLLCVYVHSYVCVYMCVYVCVCVCVCRQELQENHRCLQDMKEMSASHASLSLLDDRPMSESSTSSGQGGHGRTALYKSCDSLDVRVLRRRGGGPVALHVH